MIKKRSFELSQKDQRKNKKDGREGGKGRGKARSLGHLYRLLDGVSFLSS